MESTITLDNQEVQWLTKTLQWAITELKDSINNDELEPAIGYSRSLTVDNLKLLIDIILKKRALEAVR